MLRFDDGWKFDDSRLHDNLINQQTNISITLCVLFNEHAYEIVVVIIHWCHLPEILFSFSKSGPFINLSLPQKAAKQQNTQWCCVLAEIGLKERRKKWWTKKKRPVRRTQTACHCCMAMTSSRKGCRNWEIDSQKTSFLSFVQALPLDLTLLRVIKKEDSKF